MENKRFYHVIIGSKAYFDKSISKIQNDEEVRRFLEIVKDSDNCKTRGIILSQEQKAKVLIIKNDDYHGIVETAHDRLGALIEEITTDDAHVFVHNPPAMLKANLENLSEREIIVLDCECEKYGLNRDTKNFSKYIHEIEKNIIGQGEAVHGIISSMWFLAKTNRQKPYVIMLYGGSSLGKTELVRNIARYFFENKFMEKHLSMFKNDQYNNYFFGEQPNRKSLAFELLERESNLIFLDELDKCPEHFYSAFYTLFDNTIFKDTVYEVDISGALIMLTSNYSSIEELRNSLGLPIFYRIDKFLYFSDFSAETIYEITMNEINTRKEDYEPVYTPDDIYNNVSPLIQVEGENGRTIKNKVQKVIERLLYTEVTERL